MGSGTVGVACKLLNRKFIGIELEENYFKIAKERIDHNWEKDRLNYWKKQKRDGTDENI